MTWTIAVDWGTSSFRAFLVDPNGAVVDRVANANGILAIRDGDFAGALEAAVLRWRERHPDAPILASGMIGSRNGWREAPYVSCPADLATLAASMVSVTSPRLGTVWLAPGVMRRDAGSVPDVMRGEETQILGSVDRVDSGPRVFVLPGTHSKWVHVEQGRVQSFATFMSGEFYALLRQHSILARTLPPDDGALDEPAFLRGVRHAQASASLLNAAFSARTLSLFDRMPAQALASYLSGLVIGEELRLRPKHARAVVLVGGRTLTQRYALALETLGVSTRSLGAEATWQGLAAIARTLESA